MCVVPRFKELIQMCRHKKCDRRKPICERCSKGGYECLGYGHNKRGVPIQDESSQPPGVDKKVLELGSSGSSPSGSTPPTSSFSKDGTPRIKEQGSVRRNDRLPYYINKTSCVAVEGDHINLGSETRTPRPRKSWHTCTLRNQGRHFCIRHFPSPIPDPTAWAWSMSTRNNTLECEWSIISTATLALLGGSNTSKYIYDTFRHSTRNGICSVPV